MSYPIKPVIVLVSAWLVWTIAIQMFWTIKVSTAMTMAVVFDHDRVKKYNELRQLFYPEEHDEFFRIKGIPVVRDGLDMYYKLSVFAGVLLVVHAVALYLVNRYDVNIFGFRRHNDPP